MKRPQPDIGDLLKLSFLSNVGGARKFKRLWGTSTIGGVEVLTRRQIYYPASSRADNFEKLFKYLGIYDDTVNSNPKGIDSAWIYLNKNKGSDLPAADPTELASNYNDFVAHNLNQLWWDDADGAMPEGLTLSTSIVIEAELNTTRDSSVTTTPLLDPSWSEEQLITAIETNYDSIWDTCLVSQQGVGVINKGSFTDDVTKVVTPDEDDLSPNDPWLAAMARNALRSGGIPYSIKKIELGLGRNEANNLYYTYTLDIEIPYISFSTSSTMVDLITTDLMQTYTSTTLSRLSYPNGYYTKQDIIAMDSSDLETDPDLVTRPYRLFEDEAVEGDTRYANIWYQYNGVYYLRADAFSSPRSYGLTFKDLYKYVLTLVDSGYKKKKVKWWKKLIAIIVFVVAVFTLQPQLMGMSAAMAWSAAIIGASLILTIFSMVFSLLGMDEWASAFAAANKMIEPLVIIASIINFVSSITKALSEIAEKGIEEFIKTRVEDLVDSFVKSIVDGAKDLMSANITKASLELLTRIVKLFTLPQQLKLESINDRNKDLKAEYDNLVKEASEETNVLLGFARIYPNPATADWSMYAATFDYPYERGGGNLSLGNIQRTTKQAMRKGTYTDSAFDNILVV